MTTVTPASLLKLRILGILSDAIQENATLLR